ncbi:MAG: RCC1 domain-containing protein [Gemmatimonadales bacterium]
MSATHSRSRPFLAGILLAAVAGGCQVSDGPTSPGLPDIPALSFAISDGSHGGHGHYYFPPPRVPLPAFAGTFDGTLSPVVKICELVGATCGLVVVSFAGPHVTVDPAAEAYQALWQTKLSGLDNAKTYRIQVLLGSFLIGFADVDVVANSKEASGADTKHFVIVKNGSILPIRFRIEKGALQGLLTSVSAGGNHTCALTPGGDAYCWGFDWYGQLGDGNGGVDTDTPVPVSGGHAFQSISAGDLDHTCGRTLGSDGYCWGNNWGGELGDGNSPTDSDIPVPVSGGHAFQSISAGANYSCGLVPGGDAWCWPFKLGTNNWSDTPGLVVGGHAFLSISTGSGHACGVISGGEAHCWGENESGQLGDGNAGITSWTPVPVGGGHAFKSVSAGGVLSCGLSYDGEAYCWGTNIFGGLGDGNSPTNSDTPVPVVGGHTFQSINAGFSHTCALTYAGDAYCWGSNYSGQLGDGNGSTDSDTPVPVIGGHSFLSISAGASHTCGVTSVGKVLCWGNNDFGQLGDGNVPTWSDSPVEVAFP